MYLVRTEFMVRGGGAGEFEAGRTKLGDLMKGQPGYLGQTLLHSYSHPSKYVVTSRYENVDAAWAFARSEKLAGFIKSQPPGLITVTQQEGYEGVFDVDAEGVNPAAATCEVLADWTLDQRPGAVAEFERSRKELFELRKKHAKGFGSARLRRSGGTPNKYLAISFYTAVEDARAAQAVPEIAAFMAAHPYSLYAATPPTIEAYCAIFRMAG